MDDMDAEMDSDGSISAEEEEALLKSDNEEENKTINARKNNDENEEKEDDDDDDEDDESDNDEVEENRLIKEYLNTLAIIDENKYNYDNYVQLVDIAHKLSDLEKIRQSCELFSSVYPLAPEIWLRWLKIESSVAFSPEEIEKVEKIFRRALSDYYCPNVALEFAKFAYKSSNCDNIWDEVLSCYALHCMKGREFFVLWRKYWDKKEIPESEKLLTICKIYQKELEIPLYNMEESYIEFKVLYQKNKDKIQLNWSDIDKKYMKAKDQLQLMMPFEKQLTELDPKFHQERAELYKKYINEVQKIVDVKVLQILYERMVTECCLNDTCWIEYANYLDNRYVEYGELDDEDFHKFTIFSQSAFDLIDRALRNCTWSEKLYIYKIRLYEDANCDKSDAQSIFESALEVGYQTPEPLVALWLEYLSCLRRFTDFNEETEVQVLRNNFDYAWTSLGKQWGVLADCNCEILQFWGRLEYGPLRDPIKGRELWYTVMGSSDNATKSGLWIEFIHLEMKHDLEATRKIFRKAMSHHTELDNPMVIVSAWLRFERSNGNLDQLRNCEKCCEEVLNQINANRKHIEKQNKYEENKKKRNIKRKFDNKTENLETEASKKSKQEKEENHDQITFKKPKAPVSNKVTTNVTKEHENEEIDLTKDHLRIFLSNLDYNITEDEIREGLPELSIVSIDLIKSTTGRGRGFGYAELSSEEEVQKAIKLDNRLIKGRPIYISSVLRDKEKRQKFKYSDKLEPTKLFVKGIPYDATADELREIFEKYGKLKDVRIVYHKSGKSKGIAYVEYEDETTASMAVLKLDQYELRDHKIQVAISAPPPKTTRDSIDVKKLLGLSKPKRQTIRTEQKPRMTLIPTAVRKLVQQSSSTVLQNGNSGAEQTKITAKTNEDFRKELLNRK